jgi:hypothetical protein
MNLKQIWQHVEEDDFVREPIDEKGIEAAEAMLGVKLPETYKQLILIQNGGYIAYNAHPSPVPTNWAADHVQVDALMAISEDGILSSHYYIQEWGLPEGLVLLHGDGHMWIALDYRQTDEDPPVIFIDSEAEQIVELAPDFDTFLNGLYVVQ